VRAIEQELYGVGRPYLERTLVYRPCGNVPRLATQPDGRAATNRYRVWIDEYAGVPYQEVAAKARAHLDLLTHLYATPAREAELIAIFKETTRLEANFWEMGWRAGQRVE
jgi:thiaminase (transcriptional activator TenA)